MSVPQFPVPSRPMKLPQFGLRTMFVAITACGALFAVLIAIGPIASVGLTMVATMVCLHVLGNALGQSLRDRSAHESEAIDAIATATLRGSTRPLQRCGYSRLYERTPLGGLSRVLCVLGAGAGCIGTGTTLSMFSGASKLGILVGSISSGVLGALFGFLTGSFLVTALRAWRQAAAEPNTVRHPIAMIERAFSPALPTNSEPKLTSGSRLIEAPLADAEQFRGAICFPSALTIL